MNITIFKRKITAKLSKLSGIFSTPLPLGGVGGGLFVLLMASCADNEAEIPNLYAAQCPATIEFQLPANLTQLIYQDETGASVLPMIKGETATLPYAIGPDDITFHDVVWTSSNPECVSVDQQGNIAALSGSGLGYSIVQVAPVGMYSGSGVNCNLKVKVSDQLVKAESIGITASATEVYAGETITVQAAIQPASATYQTVKWTSSNEAAATISSDGVVTGKVTSAISTPVTITATALDGSNATASVQITVKQIVQPQSITLDQQLAAPAYLCAIGEKSVTIPYTTVPADCTTSLIEWTSSNEDIATVSDGVVTFNQDGVFGDFTITATCPETGQKSELKMTLAEGLVRETFHNPNYYSWYNAKQSGNGTESSHVWHDGYITITTYNQNATNQRADIKCWSAATWLHAGNFPIFAIKVDDVKDVDQAITSRNFNIDAVGKTAGGTDYKAIANGNNKYLHDYKCSDGSHVFIYDLSTQACGTGGLMPSNESVKFTTLQAKYADMKTIDHQIQYNLYWVQTFKSMDDLEKYITDVDKLTFEVIK